MRHFWQMLTAGFLAFLFIKAWDVGYKYVDKPERYMVVSSVSVPDHIQGQDPRVEYVRTIYRDFEAAWTARIRRVTETSSPATMPECRGGATDRYREGGLIDFPITLSWYMGKNCMLSEGKYYISTRWDIIGGPSIEKQSNIFTVRAAE